ncbi:MAG: AlwI family type II restriction endonuclease [Bifidobacteriaceae bacterium]|jgi:hypothetical protein|nr:AlwI family type II restriction endonuclease [Bifidobacteriaceae bacterium]
MAKRELKPLSFSTTIRNPERIPIFLECIAPYDGRFLTDEVAIDVARSVISKRVYKPITALKTDDTMRNKFNDTSYEFDNTELDWMIENAPQNHKEKGFSKGWASRFDTWFKIMKELGFVYYAMNEQVQLSELGKELAKYTSYLDSSIENSLYDGGESFRNAMLNSMVKYCRANPYRRVKNNNQPFTLLLRVICGLKKLLGNEYRGIYKKELSFFLCWQNNNADELATFIVNFRRENGLRASDEVYYE